VLDLVLPHLEFEGENPANSSRATDTVFNISLRLMECVAIRGLDGSKMAPSHPSRYPKNRRPPTVTDPIAKGNWVATP